jgi:hypothetical protein
MKLKIEAFRRYDEMGNSNRIADFVRWYVSSRNRSSIANFGLNEIITQKTANRKFRVSTWSSIISMLKIGNFKLKHFSHFGSTPKCFSSLIA